MPENLADRDARRAAAFGPAPDAAGPPGQRTPRWLLVWLLPLLALMLLYMARTILGPFIIAGVLAYVFAMVIDRLQDRLHWPRWLIVLALYVLVLGLLGLGLFLGAESFYQQTASFVQNAPTILQSTLQDLVGPGTYQFAGQTFTAQSLARDITNGLIAYLGGHSATAFQVATVVVGRVLDTLLVIIVSFYLLVADGAVGGYFLKFVPAGSRARTGYVAGRINTVLSAYLRGQLFLIVLISVEAFIILQVFGVPYAAPLAILTGFLEILPLVGPAIAVALVALVAFAANGTGAAAGVAIAYILMREVEDQLVMPLVVGKVVDLHPVVTIFAVLAGGAMAGVLGMLLAVPVAAAIKVILDFVYPTDPDQARAEAQPGVEAAAEEAAAEGEEPPVEAARAG